MKFTEKELQNFASPIGKTEDEQCKNAIKMVRDALKDIGFTANESISLLHPDTASYSTRMNFSHAGTTRAVKIFVQGSYANRTNIPSESDVDVAVVLLSTFWSKYPLGVSAANYGFTDSSDSLQSFKNDVEFLLRRKFACGVIRHDKSIEIKGNTYRVDADCVPCGQHRDYRIDDGTDSNHFIEGVIVHADSDRNIVNYPEQHIKNGVIKNKSTSLQFKKMVRIAKNIRAIMEDEHIKSAKGISSFLIESLLWNIPDDEYKRHSFCCFIFDDIVQYLYLNISQIPFFKEINGIKNITDDGNDRLDVCRNFIEDLYRFFEYGI